MALGTPVAGAAAYSAQNGTTVSPAYPAGILATDVVLLFTGQKPSTANGGTVTTPAGWTLREELLAAGGYGTTLGADTGNTNLRVYSWDSPVAGQTGTRSVTLAQNNVSWAFIVRIPKGTGAAQFGSADGQRTTTPTSPMSIALTNGTSATNFQTGDRAIWAMCIPTDVTTPAQFSAQSITATGATFGTATELNEPDSGTGNDIGGYSAWAAVTAGSSTTAPTVTVTLAGTRTNVRGPVVLLRVREAQVFEINAESGSFTYNGQDATLSANRNVNAEAGTFSYTGQDAELIVTAAPKEINAEAGTFTYTGQDATLARGINVNAEAGTFTYTGQDATLNRSYSFNAEAGTFTYTGQAAELLRSYSFNAEAGTFTYTGEQATLVAVRNISADAGSFSYTGQDANLSASRNVNAEAGAFSYTGQDATLLANRSVNAEAGSFSYTGQDAELIYAQAQGIDAQAGTFTIDGQTATLTATRELNAEAGSFTYTGQDASLSLGFNLNLETGAFTYIGQDASLAATRELNAEAGSFSYTGQDAALTATRSLNAEVGSFDYLGQDASLQAARALNAEAGTFTYTGQDASLSTTRKLNAEAAAFGEANPYVDPGYVDPYYSTNLTAALGHGRMFNAEAGAFIYVGQPATFSIQSLFPPEADVRLGVVYGPGGIYTGTYAPKSGRPIFVFDD